MIFICFEVICDPKLNLIYTFVQKECTSSIIHLDMEDFLQFFDWVVIKTSQIKLG